MWHGRGDGSGRGGGGSMVVVRVENTVRRGLDMLGAELRGRFSVKTGRPRSTMLWGCIAWPVCEGGRGRGNEYTIESTALGLVPFRWAWRCRQFGLDNLHVCVAGLLRSMGVGGRDRA